MRGKQLAVAYEEVSFGELQELLEQRRWDELRLAIGRVDPADLADFMEELSSDDRDTVFRLLDLETASDVLVELQSSVVDEVVEDLPSDHIADLAEQMAPDEAADFLAELDDRQSAEVLAAMEPEERQEVRELLRHEPDSAGSIMTPEMITVPATATVDDTRVELAEADFSDPVLNIYVVDPAGGTMLGLVTLPELMSADPDATVGDIADRDYVYCSVGEDQEEVARHFRKYDLWVMPVVDAHGRPVGRITVDDVMDVVHEEADEDLARMVGAPDIEEEEESLFRITRMRLPWLLITMFAGLINSVLIKTMLGVTNVATIAIFVPAILAMGGNTGMQSSAIAIRGIALGEKKYSRLLIIAFREIRVGICLGLICGAVTACLAWGILCLTAADIGPLAPGLLAAAVGASMCNAMTFASAFGALVPVLLHRLRVDPAVASGPFVTTSNDLSASLIYFVTCVILLGGS